MIRRGFLAGLGAVIGAGKAIAAGQASASQAMMNPQRGGYAVSGQLLDGEQPYSAGPDRPRAAWNAFHSAMEPVYRRRRRHRAVVEILGGMPPQIASCHSWAPWFRAQRAAAWAQAQADAEDSIEKRLRRAILGED